MKPNLIIIFFFIQKYFLITSEKRLKSKNCSYKLKIKTPTINLIDQKFHYNFEIEEILEFYTKDQNENILDSLNQNLFYRSKIKERNNIDILNRFKNYTFFFNNNLLFLANKNSNFKISENKQNFINSKDFNFKINQIPCDLKLPLISYQKFDYFSYIELQFFGFRAISTKYIELSFFFNLTALNRFHLDYYTDEVFGILKNKENFNKFKSFDAQIKS